MAEDAWHREVDEGGLLTDGQPLKRSRDAALGPDLIGPAVRAAQTFARLFDVEGRDARLKAKAVIQ